MSEEEIRCLECKEVFSLASLICAWTSYPVDECDCDNTCEPYCYHCSEQE